jgi:hypothetical protein
MAEAKYADDRLIPPDLWLLFGLGILGIIFFFAKYSDSFPAASIDLRISRTQAAALSQQWADKLGFPVQATIKSTVFNIDDDAKTFLEYELGQSRANVLMKTVVPVWSWNTRFCRPFQIADLNVGLGPDGTLHYLSLDVPNDQPARSISHDEALAVARRFVEKDAGVSLAGSKLVRDAQESALRRIDHDFVFEDRNTDYASGHLRVHVLVAGDKVCEFARYLHIPEKFQRKYADIRSYNELLKQISKIVFVILSSAVSFIFVWAFASGRIRARLCIFAAAVAALLSILNWVDTLPETLSNYETTMSFNQYVIQSLLSMLLDTFYAVIACVVFIGALEPVYRMAFPTQIAVENSFRLCAMRCPAQLRAVVAGLSSFGIHTAYVVGFYLIGQKLGFWSPLEVRETSVLSSLWPAYSAINIGLSAATMEELMYRVLGLAVFKRLTGNFWLSNLLQAAAWAFMHSDYAQEPPFARGIELTVVGFFYGYVLRRFGLIACLLAHYTYDAFLGVTPLLGSAKLADKLSALIALSPGIVALGLSCSMIFLRGKNADQAHLTNEALAQPPRSEAMSADRGMCLAYGPLPKRLLIYCVIAALVGAVLLFAFEERTVGYCDSLTISKERAVSLASDLLLQNGVSLKDRRMVAVLSDETDEDGLQYVFEKAGYDFTKRFALSLEPRLLWKVRFFQPENPQEFEVSLTPAGQFFSLKVSEDEDAAGGKLDLLSARNKAESFLKQNHALLWPLAYTGVVSHVHPARNDYDFTFRLPSLSLAEAKFEVSTAVIGNFVSDFNAYLKVPQSWKFERDKRTWKDDLSLILRIGLSVLLSVTGLTFVIELIRKRQVPLRQAAILAAVGFVFLLIMQFNSLPGWLFLYPTQESLSTFWAKEIIEHLLLILSGAAACGLLAAICLAAYRWSFPELPLISLFNVAWPHVKVVTQTTRRLWLDGVMVGLAATFVLTGADNFIDVLSSWTSPQVRILSLADVQTLGEEWSAALGGISGALMSVYLILLLVPVAVALSKRFFRGSPWRLGLFVLTVSLVSNSSQRYLQDYAWSVGETLLVAALIYLFIVRFARFNVVAYACAAYFPALLIRAETLLKHQRLDLCLPQLAVLLLAFVAPVVYAAWLYLAPKNELAIVPPDKVA